MPPKYSFLKNLAVISIFTFGCFSGENSFDEPNWDTITSSFSDFDIKIPKAGTPVYLENKHTIKPNKAVHDRRDCAVL